MAREELTEAQVRVYDLIKSGNSIRAIAAEREVTVQAVYTIISELVRKGWLRKVNRPGFEPA